MSRMLGTYSLKHAIVRETRAAGSAEITEEELKPAGFCVTLRRPKAKHMRIFGREGVNQVEAAEAMVVAVSNLSAEEVAELDAEDMAELGNLLEEAATSGPKTGATSSAD